MPDTSASLLIENAIGEYRRSCPHKGFHDLVEDLESISDILCLMDHSLIMVQGDKVRLIAKRLRVVRREECERIRASLAPHKPSVQ